VAVTTEAPSRTPAGATERGDGIVLGSGPILVEAYVDFLCPFCFQFEQRSGATLERMAADEKVTLVYHPVAFLDRLSSGIYSTRASAASACAADGGHFAEFKDKLFTCQPPEGGPGLSNADLIALGVSVGLTEPEFAECVESAAYLEWAAFVTECAVERGVSGIPAVFVDGRPVPPYRETIENAVRSASIQM
jgi:protein-disulfide isomerase